MDICHKKGRKAIFCTSREVTRTAYDYFVRTDFRGMTAGMTSSSAPFLLRPLRCLRGSGRSISVPAGSVLPDPSFSVSSSLFPLLFLGGWEPLLILTPFLLVFGGSEILSQPPVSAICSMTSQHASDTLCMLRRPLFSSDIPTKGSSENPPHGIEWLTQTFDNLNTI